MVLLVLAGCGRALSGPCTYELESRWDAEPLAPGTYWLCDDTVPTDLTLACEDDEPYVFVGYGPDETFLDRDADGEGAHRALTVLGCTVELRDLTITGAHAEQYVDCADGGGECGGTAGGALDLYAADVTLTNVRVTGNYADIAGAGVLSESTLTLVGSEVAGNENGGFYLYPGATLVSDGTTWGDNDGADVLTTDRALDRPDGDFTCTPEGCE